MGPERADPVLLTFGPHKLQLLYWNYLQGYALFNCKIVSVLREKAVVLLLVNEPESRYKFKTHGPSPK